MKKTIRRILILLCLFRIASAAETGTETVIVPYDSSKPLEGQKLDQIYVPYERFVELWEAAKQTRRGLPPEEPDASYVLSSARYDATLGADSLQVNGVIDLQTFGNDWVSIPLVFKQAKVGSLKLDGQPAPFESGRIVVEKAGHHRIEVAFEIPVKGGRTRITWGIPKTTGTLFSVKLPQPAMKAAIKPGNGVVERTGDGGKTVTAALGSTDHVELLLDSTVGLATITQSALAKIESRLGITPAVETVHTQFEFSFPESQQDHFTVSLDKTLALVKLDAPNLKSWKVTVENDRQTLEIILAEPARGAFAFSIDAERAAAGRQRRFPFFSAQANRIEQRAALFSTPETEVAPQPPAAFTQIPFDRNSATGLRLVAAYSSTGDWESLNYEARPAKPADKAAISYVYLVNHSKIELIAALKLRTKDRGLFDVALDLPPDFVVQAVESDRLKDWWRDDDTLHVRFRDGTPETTPLVLHLVKQFKNAPDALEIKPINLPEPWELEGDGVIVAGKSVKAGMTISGAKEIDPQNAAADFRILPPMERKRGFSFKGRDFRASVKLETLPARVAGAWIMSAQAHESWVSVSTHVNLAARQGSADAAVFKLPSAMPEARVAGENVRETTSRVEDGWRIYRVAFQNDLTDGTDFTVDFDLPCDGAVSLPAFELAGVERTDGFVIVDNASDYEMQTQPSGLEVAASRDIPFLPEVSRNARLFRAQPGWSLQISLTKLEKEAGRAAYVAWAELTTAIRSDGSEWHRATYHLQNRSLQFLPVKLPKGAELASVSVAGENVRADRGKANGVEVLLVPLIKTKPGDVSYDVELVYRNAERGGLFGFMTRKSLADPDVVGITVERTLWNLYVPEDAGAPHFGGNMEEVLSEVNKTEKLEGMLDELKQLNSLIVSKGRSSGVAQEAGENFRRLAKSLEDDSDKAAGNEFYADIEPGKKEVLKKQGEYVSKRKSEIREELERQRQSFESNLAKAAPAAPAPAQQPGSQVRQAAPVSQIWVSNGDYVSRGIVQSDRVTDQKDMAGKKQLYINDYVMNVQGGAEHAAEVNAYTGATVLNGGNLDVTVNMNATMNATGGATASGMAGTVAMGDARVQMKAAQIQSEQALRKDAADLFEVNPPQAAAQSEVAAAALAPQMTPMLEKQVEGNVKILGSARANSFQSASGPISQVAPQDQQSQAWQQLPNASDRLTQAIDAQQEGKREPSDVAKGISDFTSAWSTSGGVEGGTAPSKARQLQPAGAISLPVDFPIGGRVYHFKKLKANARLTFWFTHPQNLVRWKWLLVFLVASLLAKAVFRFADRSQGRTALLKSNGASIG